MKSYNDFLLETLNLENFNDDYDKLISDLYEYWDILNDRIKDLSEFNINRNPVQVAKYNQQIKSGNQTTINPNISSGTTSGVTPTTKVRPRKKPTVNPITTKPIGSTSGPITKPVTKV